MHFGKKRSVPMDDNKKYSPYHGCWMVLLALIGVPLLAYAIILAALRYYEPQFYRLNPASAQCLGCLVGSFFHMSCIIGGLLRDAWRAFCFRIREFLENLPCGLPFALQCYWEDMKQDGVLFLPYAMIIGACLYFAIEGGITALSYL